MNAAAVSAVIVTRGDVDLTEILESLPEEWERVVWDNGAREVRRHRPGSFTAEFRGNEHTGPLLDLAVYGRYAAIHYGLCDGDVIFIQDDDCIVDAAAIAAAYEPGRLVANMPTGRWPDYLDSALVGWGAIFDRNLPGQAFERFDVGHPAWGDAEFYRTCDVVFSALTPRTVIDVGFRHLPWAEDPGRAMFLQPGHKTERDRMLDICRRVRMGRDDDRRTAA